MVFPSSASEDFRGNTVTLQRDATALLCSHQRKPHLPILSLPLIQAFLHPHPSEYSSLFLLFCLSIALTLNPKEPCQWRATI